MSKPSYTIPYVCPHCGNIGATARENGPHLELRCDVCHRYIKFINKRELETYA